MPIEIKNVTGSFLKNIECVLEDRSLTLIVGRAGSGKSTLLRTLAGLTEIDSGNVYYDGRPLWDKNRINRSLLLSSSTAFQFPEHQLFARTVRGELDYSLRPYRFSQTERSLRTGRALQSQRLSDTYLPMSPFTLSGGQKRRVALASILAPETPWLFLDEPSAGLDAGSLRQLLKELSEWKTQRGIVLVTHDIDAFLPVADRVLIMQAGRVTASLTPKEIDTHPERLVQAGIGLTGMLEVREALREAGIRLPSDLREPEQIAAAINRERRDANSSHPAEHLLVQTEAFAEKETPSHEPDEQFRKTLAIHGGEKRHVRPFLYRMDVKWKWILYTLLSIGIIFQKQWAGAGLALLIAAACVLLLSGEDRGRVLRMSKLLILFMAVPVLIAGVHISFTQGVGLLDRFQFSASRASDTLLRLIVLFEATLLGFVFTLSTSTSSMKEGLEALLRPLKRIRFPVETAALAASLVLRFIPLIIEESERFAAIAKARGKSSARKGQIHPRDIPVFVIPLLVALLHAVEDLILAMEMKGWNSALRKKRG